MRMTKKGDRILFEAKKSSLSPFCISTQSRFYPTRIPLKFTGKEAWIVLDQLRTVDRKRLIEKLGEIDQKTINQVKSIIKEMFVQG